MNIDIQSSDGVVTIALRGKLNTATSPQLDKALESALKDAKQLIFDFEGLAYVSSAGLRVLLEAYQVMSKRGGMKLTRVNDAVMEVLVITNFVSFLDIE